MPSVTVKNPTLARGVFELARVGFSGTPSAIAAASGAAITGQVAVNDLRLMQADLEKLGVTYEFKRKGNNNVVEIGKTKNKRAKTPDFVAPQADATEVTTGPQSNDIHDLQAEVEHLRLELRASRAAERSKSRDHGLFQAIARELDGKIVPMAPMASQKPVGLPTRDLIEETLVVHLSDGHHDQVIHKHETNGLEEYNFNISCRRAETFINTILKWTHTTLNNFRFPRVVVLAYGDHTSGEIHGAVERSTFRNQFRNTLAIGQLHGLMFRDLASHFPAVDVVYVPGNHGRRTHKKEYTGPWNNWDYLVGETARLYCQDLDNLSFNIPESFSANVEIEGIGFHVSHGDDVAGAGGTPWYGLQRRQGRLMALNYASGGGPRIRYVVCGHYHKPAEVGDMDGSLIVNGPWPATDAYSFNKFSGFTEPCQLIHGVTAKRGMTWRLPVQLRTKNEAKGPERYKIELMSSRGTVESII
jgi:hypothetical protein